MSNAEQAIKDVAKAERVITMLKMERDDVAINLVPIDIRVAMEEVKQEYNTKILGWEVELEEAKKAAVTLVLQAKGTVEADGLQAVYVKGRRGAWDDDRITELVRELADCWLVKSLRMANQDKFAEALEVYLGDFANALLNARKPDGQPSVSWKHKKEKA